MKLNSTPKKKHRKLLRLAMGLCLGFSILAGTQLFAIIELQTTIRDIQLGGTAERTGLISFRIGADDFPDISPSNPAYIRLRFEKNALLAETLVDIQASPTGHQPIGLVARVISSSGSVINLSPLSITIARWRKGENAIWLKISTSSSFWVTRNGVPGPPTISEPVIFTVGQTIEESTAANAADFNANRANLLVATRGNGTKVDTSIRVDLRQSNLQASPAPDSLSLLGFDPVTYASDTQGVETSTAEPMAGSLRFPSYVGEAEIGRGVGFRIDRWLFHVPRDQGGFESQILFSNRGQSDIQMMLRAYDAEAQVLVEEMVSVEGGRFRILEKQDIFADLPVSHVQILGPETCLVGISYRAVGEPSLTASSPEDKKTSTFWEYYPESESFGFDGFALVNLGMDAATLTMTMLNQDGQSLGAETLFDGENFEPFAKKLILLGDLIPQGTNPVLLRFTSSQPLGIVALRGTLPGNGPRSLFPVPIFTTVSEN